MPFFWPQPLGAIEYIERLVRRQRNKLWPHLDAKTRKIIAVAIAPLVLDIFEQRVGVHLFFIGFEVLDITTQRPIDTLLGNNNPSFQIKALTQLALPKHHRCWVADGHKLVV